MYMYVGRLQTARVEGMMHIGETEEWKNWKLFYIDHVTLYRIKFNRLKKKKAKKNNAALNYVSFNINYLRTEYSHAKNAWNRSCMDFFHFL